MKPEELRPVASDEPPSTKRDSVGAIAHADMAKAMIVDLEALEHVLRDADPRRVTVYRGFRMSLGAFVEMFEAWTDPAMVFQQKERELQDFFAFRDVVLAIAKTCAPPSTSLASIASIAHADAKAIKAMIADLDALERVLRKTDPRRVTVYRGFRMSLGAFVEMFDAWSDPAMVLQQKERELQDFLGFRDVVLAIAKTGAPSA